MADTTIKRTIAGFAPQDFVEGAGLPKRLHGPVKMRYCPWPLKRGGEKYGFYAVIRINDEETEKAWDVAYRIGWLPKIFTDKGGEARATGTMPSNDGPDVKDNEREGTASEAFFMALGEGSKAISADVDIFEKYGGEYSMGDFPSKKEQFHHLVSSLAQCGFDFPSQSLASLDDFVLTLESMQTGTYKTKDNEEKAQFTHLVTDMIAPTKSSKKKAAAKVEPEEEEEEETPKPKKAKTPPPEDDDEDTPSPVQVLESVIVGILKGTPTKTMEEGKVFIAAAKSDEFQALSKKEQKIAQTAYNDRSLFEESAVLVYDEDEDEISYEKPRKK